MKMIKNYLLVLCIALILAGTASCTTAEKPSAGFPKNIIDDNDANQPVGVANKTCLQDCKKSIGVYYRYAIPDENVDGPFTENNNHAFIDAAIIDSKWALTNPAEGKFDWTLVDKKIADWTGTLNPNHEPSKKIIIKIQPYNQEPLTNNECKRFIQCQVGDNSATPHWIYNKNVEKIKFSGGGVAEGDLVSVPRAWDSSTFLHYYEAYLQSLGNHYNNDKRVLGYELGFGHLGNTIAQPSKEGATAFITQGWTVNKWKDYIKEVIDISEKHLQKRLFIGAPPLFLRKVNKQSFGFKDYPIAAKEIIRYSAEKGISISFSGLTPNEDVFQESFIPEIVEYLGSLNIQSDKFAIGFTDDWPLWVPPKRSGCPSPTCGRNVTGFDKELSYTIGLWDKINRKYPIFIRFLKPEASATNKLLLPCLTPKEIYESELCFRQDVYDVAVK